MTYVSKHFPPVFRSADALLVSGLFRRISDKSAIYNTIEIRRFLLCSSSIGDSNSFPVRKILLHLPKTAQ